MEVLRKCIVSGELLAKEKLLRFTEIEARIIPDFYKKLPGKGIYVKNAKTVLTKGIEKKIFSKVSKKNIGETLELVSMVENLLRKKGLDSVNFAKKAGVLVTGLEKVKHIIKVKKTAFLHEGIGAGEDGTQRIKALAGDLEIFSIYTIEELDEALNRVNTVHIAFKKSDMVDKVYYDFCRVKEFLEN